LNRSLLRRKTRFGSSKGISTAVGTVFLVLTVFIIGTNIFLWTLTQNTIYNQAVKERNQQDVDRLIENVVGRNTNFVVPSTGRVNVTAELMNAGSISAQIVTLWVLDATQRKYNVTDLRASNINLNPGDRLPLMRVVDIPDAVSDNVFNSWLVTARGNKVNLETVQSIIVANLSQGIGSMALDFLAFRYFTYQTSTRLANYPSGINTFNVPSRTFIAFGVVLTNLDPSEQTIILNRYSQCWLYFPKSPGSTFVFYVVNVEDDGTITTPYSPITIAFTETKFFVFASDTAGSLGRVSITSAVENLPCALNLLLLGTIGTRDYGQNIPFVSLYVYKP